MLAQFLAVKSAHADCLLFYRMGDFYEMFFQDAVDAAAALDITLTRRGKVEEHDVPMCGVPVHAAESYLSRLIRKGFRVAICEQSESPEEAKKRGHKGPLKRDVIRIVTPGTLVEDEFLPPRENNYLIALGQSAGEMALSWVDLSTGDLWVETVEAARVEETLARLNGAELIASDRPDAGHGFEGADPKGIVGCVSLRPARVFDSAEGQKKLCDVYGVTTLDGIATLSRAETSAAGALVTYLDQTQKGRALRLKPIQKMTRGAVMEIDPASRRSLEITRTLSGKTQGSLLSVIDRTTSAAGGRLLARRIAAPLTDLDAINARLDLVAAMMADPVMAAAVRQALTTMPDVERSLSRLNLGHGGPRDVAALARGAQAGMAMAEAISARAGSLMAQDMLAEMSARLTAPFSLAGQIDQTLADELPLLARDGGFIRQGFNPALDEVKAMRDESRRLIAQLQQKYIEETGIASLKIKHNNVLGYHIDVRANHADTMMALEPFIHRQTTAQTVRFTTTELAELEREMSGAGDRALALELTLFDELCGAVLARANDLIALAEVGAKLDVATATARLAEQWQYSRPTLKEGREFEIASGRHPVVEQMLDKDGAQPFISNHCHLHDDDRIWLLTGPNMAGKSTFLRQNALIALMAQAGLYVPAERAEIGIVDRLFCRVGASDDLATGRSTFMVEMVETAAILNRSGPSALVILDEIGRGTATYDGLSLAWAVVEHLHEVNQCRALFATHYHELNGLERSLDALSPHAMQVKEWQGEIVFLHEVAKGGADRSYGIHVARLAGVPASVLERAEDVLTSLSEENSPLTSSRLDDLPLFSAEVAAAPPAGSSHDELLAHLDGLLPDTMTPMQALEAIYALRALRNNN
ncbi:MAG: DNA mismatch repair protein MutS [Alphaproteobacteria bacterium]|nr:DNA mismatch repair protein MutS [Alphaproteobacteria bacterium]